LKESVICFYAYSMRRVPMQGACESNPVMGAVAAFVLFFVPLALAPRLLFYFDVTPKVVILLVAAAAAILWTALNWDSFQAYCGTFHGRWYTVAAFALITCCLVSAALSPDAALAWTGSNWRRLGAIPQFAAIAGGLALAAWACGDRVRLSLLLRATCAAGVCASAYGIAQYFGWDPILPASGYEAGEGPFRIVRPPGPLGHSDYFTAYLVWPIFLGVGLIRGESRRGWRLLGWAAAFLGAAAILFSGSRGAALGLLVGAVVLAVSTQVPWRRMASAAAIMAVTLALIYVSPAGVRLRARAHWIGEERLGGARLLLWRDSVTMAAARPFTGVGPDNFAAEFPRFESPALARAYPDFYHESPHNLWLDTLTGEGGLALLAQLMAVGVALAAGLRAKTHGEGPFLLAGFAGVLVAHHFVVFTATNALFFYLGAALLAGLSRIANPVTDASPPNRGVKSLALTTAIATGLVLCVIAFRLIQADAELGTAKRLLNTPDRRGAVNAYQRAVGHRSSSVTADLFFSRSWAQLATTSPDVLSKLYFSQMAAESAAMAVQSPEQRQNGWYNLAELAATRGDGAALETSLRAAIAAAPNWFKPHWALARLLYSQGRIPEARAEAQRVAGLYDGADAEVSASLAEILSFQAHASSPQRR
jgi:putative inorganic carbon (HCO3(-)) transporter